MKKHAKSFTTYDWLNGSIKICKTCADHLDQEPNRMLELLLLP